MLKLKRPVILFFVTLLIYNLNLHSIPSGDTIPSSLIPITLVTKGNMVMDEFNRYYLDHTSIKPYFFQETRFGYLPAYPVATGILLSPFYAVPVYLYHTRARTPAEWVRFAGIAEKISASTITALSVVLFYFLAIQLSAAPGLALLLSLVYAFGSQAWSTSSQALWPHGSGILFMLAAGLLAIRQMENPSTLKGILFSVACGIVVSIRPTNLVFVIPLYIWMIVKQPLFFRSCTWPMALIGITLAGFNYIALGNIKGAAIYLSPFSASFWDGFKVLLFSPGRGLFLYFPLALFGFAGFYQAFHDKHSHLSFFFTLLVFVSLQIALISKWASWWGGYSYGPRLLTETEPMLLLLSIPLLNKTSSNFLIWSFFTVFFCWSLFIQTVGAIIFPIGKWNHLPASINEKPERLWDWKDNPVSRDVKSAAAMIPLLIKLTPQIDLKDSYRTVLINQNITLVKDNLLLFPFFINDSDLQDQKESRQNRSRIVLLNYFEVQQTGELNKIDTKQIHLSPLNWTPGSNMINLPIPLPDLPGDYMIEIRWDQEGNLTRKLENSSPFQIKMKIR